MYVSCILSTLYTCKYAYKLNQYEYIFYNFK